MVYDSVYTLAKEIKQGDEYQKYAEMKQVAFENESNKSLIREYQKLTVEAQMYLAAKQEIPTELSEKLQKLYDILQMNTDALNYLLSEHRLNEVMGDVFRILSKEVDINLDFLSD